MDRTHLPVLKHKLQTATNFAEVTHFFFDHFGEDDEFMALGDQGKNPLLRKILAAAAKTVFGKPTPIKDLLMIHVPEMNMWHGPCELSECMSNFFYFDDLDMGMLSIVRNARTGDASYIRITSKRVTPGEGSQALSE